MKKNVNKKASEVEKPPHETTPIEIEAIEAYMAARKTAAPRLKLKSAGDSVVIGIDHPDPPLGTIFLMRAVGSTDAAFFNGLLGQLVNASKGKVPSEEGANFMLAVVKGLQPRDQIEAMLGAQMAAVHMATMTFAGRLAHVDNIPQQDSASNRPRRGLFVRSMRPALAAQRAAE